MSQIKSYARKATPPSTQLMRLSAVSRPVVVSGMDTVALHFSGLSSDQSLFVVIRHGESLLDEITRVCNKIRSNEIEENRAVELRFVAPSAVYGETLKCVKALFPDARGREFNDRIDLLVSFPSIKIDPQSDDAGKTKANLSVVPGNALPVSVVPKAAGPLRVLVIDDSKTVRLLMRRAIHEQNGMEIVGEIGDPRDAIKAVQDLKPDVITLDIQMPHMLGPEVLRELNKVQWTPTVIVTSLNINESKHVLDALDEGAIDYIQKPEASELALFQTQLTQKLKIAAKQKKPRDDEDGAADRARFFDPQKAIVIGSSTGGTEAIKHLFSTFPDDIPPVLITQHIPAGFSRAFADRLNTLFPFNVKEAEDGDLLRPNQVLIAAGDYHMSVVKGSRGLSVKLNQEDLVSGHRPSVNVLFESAAKVMNGGCIGVILTGMGDDGAQGLVKMKESGAYTIAQNESSCVVYGMPKAAVALGGVVDECDLYQIATLIARR